MVRGSSTLRLFFALIAALGLTLSLITVPTAHAQKQQSVTITDVRVQSENGGTITQNEVSLWSINWSLDDSHSLAAGDTFRVEFPEPFKSPGDLTLDLISVDKIVGANCQVDADGVTCTFNDAFVGKSDVGGTMTVNLRARGAKDDRNVTLNINGIPKTFNNVLPGDGVGVIGRENVVTSGPYKWGWYTQEQTHISWNLWISGEKLAAMQSPVTITDEVTGFATTYVTEGSRAPRVEKNPAVKRGSGWVVDAAASSFGGTVTIETTGAGNATFKMTPPAEGWRADHHYKIVYFTTTTHGQPASRDEPTTNKATFTATDESATVTVFNEAGASGTIKGVSKASYEVTKEVTGAKANAVAADTEFTVQADIVKNDPARTAKTETIKVKNDGLAAKGLEELPVGSTVTLSEIELPAINDVVFGDPVFSSADPNAEILEGGKKIRFTTIADTNIKVKLTNQATEPVTYGQLKLKKVVTAPKPEGFDTAAPAFDVKFTCDKASKDGDIAALSAQNATIYHGQEAKVVGEFPVGTRCWVDWEDEDAARQPFNGYALKMSSSHPDQANAVVISADNAAETNLITVTNSYTKVVGKFKVVKTLNNPDRVAVPQHFNFDYVCTSPTGAPITGTIANVETEAVVSEDIPVGYTCSVTEDRAAAEVTGATLVIDNGSAVTIAADSVPSIEVSNSYSKDLGSFTIAKSVVDPDNVAKDKTFHFTFECTPPSNSGEQVRSGQFTLKANQTHTEDNITAGSTCIINEDVAAAQADVDGTLTSTGVDVRLTISRNQTTEAVVTNTYSQWKGSVKVEKQILGSDAAVKAAEGKPFTGTYECVKGEQRLSGDFVVKVGEVFTITNVPANANCTIIENLTDAALTGFKFEEDKSTTTVNPAPFTANNGESTAQLRNFYTELGAFQLKKNVSGLSGSSVKEFTVLVSWLDQTRTVTVGDGSVIADFPQLPVGTIVTFEEKLPENTAIARWKTPVFSGPGVTDLGNGKATLAVQSGTLAEASLVTLKNSANPPWWWLLVPMIPLLPKPPTPSSPPPPAITTPSSTPAPSDAPATKGMSKQPKAANPEPKTQARSLANTGFNAYWLLFLAVILVLLGVALLRRGSSSAGN